jgi:hypothetical protein
MWVAYSVNIESIMTAVMRFKWRRNGRGETSHPPSGCLYTRTCPWQRVRQNRDSVYLNYRPQTSNVEVARV